MITTRADLLPELKSVLAKIKDLPGYMDIAEIAVSNELDDWEGDVFCPEAEQANRSRDSIAFDLGIVIDWLENSPLTRPDSVV